MASSSENATYMTSSDPPKGSSSGGAVKPTLLAFHGSGSNATVHKVQLARLTRVINPYFQVESLEGTLSPFSNPPCSSATQTPSTQRDLPPQYGTTYHTYHTLSSITNNHLELDIR
jgi:predicted esterase